MKSLSIICLLFLIFSARGYSGTFDCTVVYDEYDSLMNKYFIISPENYVTTEQQKISRIQYNKDQKNKFLLKGSRKGYGIAMFRTNRNSYGKFLFTWGAPFNNGQPSLILKDIVRFGRVLDGFAPKYKSKLVVKSSYTVDLDTFSIAPAAGTADLWFHNVNGVEMYAEAIGGAQLHFPMESLCK